MHRQGELIRAPHKRAPGDGMEMDNDELLAALAARLGR